MTHSFDVIREPWIRVRTLEGKFEYVSVRELFEKAHTYKEISEPNMFYDYGIQNFLIALFASVYDMQTVNEKFEILKSGQFDMIRFDTYIEKCETKRPNCFNLFGDNPFYQNKYAKYDVGEKSKCSVDNLSKLKIKKTAMIGKIALDVPSGNNSVHFVNDAFVGKKLSFGEVTKALVSYGLFQAGQDGPNSANGVNGGMNYPFYIMIKGNNLFQYIVLNTATADSWHTCLSEKVPYIGNAVWECEPILVPKQVVKSVSMVEGLTFQNRFILLSDVDKNKQIGDVYFGPGRVFESEKGVRSLWRQPNAAYKAVKDKKTGQETGEFSALCMNRPTDVWTEVGNLFRYHISEGCQPLTVREYQILFVKSKMAKIMKEFGYTKNINNMQYKVYYICVDGGKFPPKKQGIYENYIPNVLFTDGEKLSEFCSLIDGASAVGGSMQSSAVRLSRNLDKDLNGKELKKKYQKKFAENYYAYIDTELLPMLLSDISDISDFNSEENVNRFIEICNQFKLDVRNKAVEVFTNTVLSANNAGLWKVEDKKTGKILFKGAYGMINDDIRKLMGTINKILGLESRKETANGD